MVFHFSKKDPNTWQALKIQLFSDSLNSWQHKTLVKMKLVFRDVLPKAFYSFDISQKRFFAFESLCSKFAGFFSNIEFHLIFCVIQFFITNEDAAKNKLIVKVW